jgi:hypothetical protein
MSTLNAQRGQRPITAAQRRLHGFTDLVGACADDADRLFGRTAA